MTTKNVTALFEGDVELSAVDNTPEGLKVLRTADERFRQVPWLEPFHQTEHRIWRSDARDWRRRAVIPIAIARGYSTSRIDADQHPYSLKQL